MSDSQLWLHVYSFEHLQDYKHTHLLKRVGTKTPKLAPPFGSGCIPPALTTLLLSDVAGVMGSDNVLPAGQFNQSN